MKTFYFKLVSETLSFDKEILVDVNCASINQVNKEIEKHKELLTENNTWIIYGGKARTHVTLVMG